MEIKLIVKHNEANSTSERNWDYIAYVEDDEESGLVGYGSNEEEAARHLMEMLVYRGFLQEGDEISYGCA